VQAAKLLTVPTFAAELGVTPACIRRWILERKITIIKVGRLVRVPASEVERIMQLGTRPALRETRSR
jgi:excisionase family DNA binding protein